MSPFAVGALRCGSVIGAALQIAAFALQSKILILISYTLETFLSKLQGFCAIRCKMSWDSSVWDSDDSHVLRSRFDACLRAAAPVCEQRVRAQKGNSKWRCLGYLTVRSLAVGLFFSASFEWHSADRRRCGQQAVSHQDDSLLNLVWF